MTTLTNFNNFELNTEETTNVNGGRCSRRRRTSYSSCYSNCYSSCEPETTVEETIVEETPVIATPIVEIPASVAPSYGGTAGL